MTIETPSVEARSYFESLQVMRAFAALMVVFGHALYEVYISTLKMGMDVPAWVKTDLPYSVGVDIFFVLSGFLMVYTSQKLFQTKGGWKVFLKKRFVRIVPLYWFYTTLIIITIAIMPSAFGTASADVWHYIQSYLFIPHERPIGGVKPVLSLGWTLNYEMFFYAVFACFIVLSRQKLMRWVGVLFLILASAGLFIPQDWTILHFISNPIILEFLIGMMIADLFIRGVRLPNIYILIAVIVSVISFIYVPFRFSIDGFEVSRLPGTIMATLLIGVCALCPALLSMRLPKWIKLLGDSSYTLYLAHPFAIGVVSIVAIKISLTSHWHILLSLVACIVGSIIAYYIIEKPLVRLFKKSV